MDNQVQFNEPGDDYMRNTPRGPRRSWLINAVIKLGLAKDDKQATIVLIIVGVIAIALAFMFWPKGGDYQPAQLIISETQRR